MSNPIIEAIGPTRPRGAARPLADIIGEAVDAGLSDAEIKAAVARRKAGAGPSFALTDYAPEDKAGPLSPQQQAADVALAKDPMAEGDPNINDQRWQHLTGNTPADKEEVDRQQSARGFAGFALGQLAGPLVGGGLASAGMRPGLANVVGGMASGALPTAAAGGTPAEIVKDAAIGAALPAVGGAMTAAGKGVLSSRGAQARQRIEKAGGTVGLRDSGSGLPEFAGREDAKITDADIGESARGAAKQLLAENDRRFDVEGRQPYKAARAEIDKGQGRNLVDVIPLRREMSRVAKDPSTDPATRNFLANQIAEMDAAYPMDNGRQHAPESWVNGKTAMLWNSAKPGLAPGSGSVRDAKIGEVATVGQRLREAGPYADANRKYADAKEASGDFREALGGNRKPSPDENINERRAANALARRGQSTTTAGIQNGDKRLQELLDANPELARIAEAPELLRAKADLQFGLGGHGGLLDRVVHASTMGMALHNAKPLAGRLLYEPAQAAVPTGEAIAGAGPLLAQQSALKNNPILALYMAAKKREEDRAEAINALSKTAQ